MEPRVSERARHGGTVVDPRASLALWLRAGRAQRKLTLDDVARVTKIQPRILEKLEAGYFDGLPAEVFVKGFVRSFARCVGLDEREALERYGACAGIAPVARALVETMSDLAPVTAKKIELPAVVPVVLNVEPEPAAIEVVVEAEAAPIVVVEEIAPVVAVEAIEVAADPVAMIAIEAPAPPKKKRAPRKKAAAANGTTAAAPTTRSRKKKTVDPIIVDVAAPVVEEIAAPVVEEIAPPAVELAAGSLTDLAEPEAEPIASVSLPAIEVIDVIEAASEPSTSIDTIDTTDTTAAPESPWRPTMPPMSTAPSAPWRRPAFASTYVAPSLVIDDADPESADEEREARESARSSHRVSFLPPILLDREDKSGRQGGLTLAVIILLIAATLTLSYLMRRPSVSGDGVTQLESAPALRLS